MTPIVYLSPSTQGANLGLDGIPELSRMRVLAEYIVDGLEKAGVSSVLAPRQSLREVIQDSNRIAPNLHIALHSNAGGGSGTETWVYKPGSGTKSAEFGTKLQAALVNALGLPDRGIKDGQALAEIKDTKSIAVLTEIFFHDNETDIKRFNENYSAVVAAIVNTVCAWFGVPIQNTGASTITPTRIQIGSEYLDGLMIDGHAYAPVRALVEHLGKNVTWDAVEKVVRVDES